MTSPRYQLRFWREGGFRFPPLARLTNGRFGLGRWTQAELDNIKRRARESYEKYKHLWEEDDRE